MIAVLTRAQAGDAEAFGQLYRAFWARVYGLCRSLLGARASAEDACSEVFIRAQRALPSFDLERPFAPWILRIASNHCLNQLRRNKFERRVFDSSTDTELSASDEPSPVAKLDDAQQRADLRQAIEALPENYRVPLILHTYAELNYDAIAAELGISRDSVATLLLRAKRRVRANLLDEVKQ